MFQSIQTPHEVPKMYCLVRDLTHIANHNFCGNALCSILILIKHWLLFNSYLGEMLELYYLLCL